MSVGREGQTDGQTDRQTDGRTDGRTDVGVESLTRRLDKGPPLKYWEGLSFFLNKHFCGKNGLKK